MKIPEPGNCVYMSSDGWKVFRIDSDPEGTGCMITHNGNFIATTNNESTAFRIIYALRREEKQ
jgi:hypothetical protein